jgi:3-deoxy-D-manno-octulosonate 8-phosphate phosphatase (KDO 8-P phosphatase)
MTAPRDAVPKMAAHPTEDVTIPADIAKRIKLVVLDVDGVLTDAGIYVGRLPDGGEFELKRFDIQDGLALKLLMRKVTVALVSGRVSEATAIRARELGIEECLQEPGAQKMRVMKGLMERHGVDWPEVAMLGDDLPDIAVFVKVGLPVAVANATPELVRYAVWQTKARGGHGAVREFCRELMIARGEWDDLVRAYVEERGG